MKNIINTVLAFIKAHAAVVIASVSVVAAIGVGIGGFAYIRWHRQNKPDEGKNSHQHVYVEEVVPATCKQGGYILHTCACGDQYKTDESEPLTHEYGEWAVIQAASIEAEGKRAKTCIYCMESVFELIPKIEHEHTYATEVIAPTCTEGGYTTFACSVCAYSFVGDLTATAPHNWTEWITTADATTSAPGEKAHTCTVCGITEYVAIPKLEEHVHAYVSTIVAPTCTESGYTVHACGCGFSFQSDLMGATDHSYGDWIVTVEPTTESTGLRQRTCAQCGYICEEVTPALDPVTGEVYEHYIDPRIKSELVAGGAMSYYCPDLTVSFNDTRTWGSPPSIWITEAGGFRIIYFQKDGTKTECALDPIPGYSVLGYILEDGTFGARPFGDFND